MNKAQKAAYKADYAQAKAEGKPFFPYAVYKDHIVASLVIGFIIFLHLGTRTRRNTTAGAIGVSRQGRAASMRVGWP